MWLGRVEGRDTLYLIDGCVCGLVCYVAKSFQGGDKKADITMALCRFSRYCFENGLFALWGERRVEVSGAYERFRTIEDVWPAG